jgi:hypothetical protein
MLACIYDYIAEKKQHNVPLRLHATKMTPAMNTAMILSLILILQIGDLGQPANNVKF